MVLTGHCKERTQHTAYDLFSEVMHQYLTTIPPELSSNTARTLLGNLGRLIPDLFKMIPDLALPAILPPEQEQLRMMTSITNLIKLAAEQRPWFLVLEDLHWVDHSSLEILLYLSRNLPQTALFIIATYRPSELSSTHHLSEALSQLHRYPGYETIALNYLDAYEVQLQLEGIWKRNVPLSWAQAIYKHTGGQTPSMSAK